MDEDEVQVAFGHNLRRLRQARGQTRRDFGEAMGGFGEAYIGAIERGDRNLRLQTVVHLSRLAGADPFELLRPPPDWPSLRAAARGDDPGPRPGSGDGRGRPQPPTES